MSEKSFRKSEFKRTIDLGKAERGQDTDLIRVWRESTGEEKAISLGDINGGLIGDYVPYNGAVDDVDLGEKGISAGYVKYDTTPTATPTDQGTTYWDVDDNTLAVIMNGTILKVGEDQYYPVKNQTGVLIPKGTAVRFAGTLGASGRLLIAPFLADGSLSSSRFMGVTSEDIGDGEDGKVMWFGRIRGLNTNSFNEGDILYASTTVAGGFQTTVPVAPNNIVEICAVVHKSASNGIIFVRPSFITSIEAGAGLSLDSLNRIQLGKTEPFFQLIDLKDFEVGGASAFAIQYNDDVFYEDFYKADRLNDDVQKALTLTSINGYRVQESYFANVSSAEYSMRVRNASSLNSYYLRFLTDDTTSIASFQDNLNQKGLEYAGDYEANFTARSLVTKQYVDGAISGAGHSPVTIGSPANGLSIDASQVLTIGLASTSATGALSSTDWNTFNGKIGGSLTSGRIPFATGSNTLSDDSGFIWNNTNKNLTITGNTTSPVLNVVGTSQVGVRENLLKFSVSDAGNDALYISNGTITDGVFWPSFAGYGSSTTRAGISFLGMIPSSADVAGSDRGILNFETVITDNATNPINGTFSSVSNRNLITVQNRTTNIVTVSANGNIGIGANSPSQRLTVFGATTTTPDNSVWITSGNPISSFYGETALGNIDFFIGGASSTPNVRPVLIGRKSRGSLANPSSLVNADIVFSFVSSGFSGTQFINSASINMIVDETVNTSSVPQAITFETGNTSRTERLRINSSGNVLIGTTSDSGHRLDVNGTTRIRTISNLGTAATSVLVPSATGVVSLRTLAEFLSDAGGISGTIASGQVAFGTGVNTVGGSNNLFWDSVNGRLGVGTSTLNHRLTVGNASSQNTLRIVGNSTTDQAPILSILRIGNRESLLYQSNNTFFILNTSGVANYNDATLAALTGIALQTNGNVGIAINAPTNTLDVNGTARIRTISNLGTAATSVLVPSATGVVSLRTLAELASDAGLTNFWTLVGSDIYRNSAVAIGRTTIPTNSTFAVQSLTATGAHQFFQLLNNAGTVLASFTQNGDLGINTSPVTDAKITVRSPTDNATGSGLQVNNLSGSSIFQVTGATVRSNGFTGINRLESEIALGVQPRSSQTIAIRVYNNAGARTVDIVGSTGNYQSVGGAFFGISNTTAPTGRVDIRGIGTTTNSTLLLEDSAGTDNAIFLDNGQIRFLRLPTSSAGLAAGSLWNNGGVLNIV